MKAVRASRPLSSAANFFRKNGATPPKGGDPKRASQKVPTPLPRAPALEATREEREFNLFDVLSVIIAHVREFGLSEDNLFLKDPSATSQDAMMGVATGVKEYVRAVRELLDVYARNQGDEALGRVLDSHDVHIWALAVKTVLKETAQPLVPVAAAARFVEFRDLDNEREKIILAKRILSELPQREWGILRDLCTLLNDCLTSKDKLGKLFFNLLLLPRIGDAAEASSGNLLAHMDVLCSAMELMIYRAGDIFSGDGPPSHRPISTRAAAVKAPPAAPPVQEFAAVSLSETPPPPPPIARGPAPPKPAPKARAYLFLTRCTFDFDPAQSDELELRVGDVVEVLNDSDEDWYKGRLRLPDGTIEEGLFPSSFVVRLDDEEAKREDEVLGTDLYPTAAPPPALPPVVYQPTPAPLPAPVPAAPAAVAAPPASPPQEHWGASSVEWSATTVAALPPPPPPPPSSGPVVTGLVLFDFVPEEAVELALTKGEVVEILNQSDPDWCLGRRSDGVQGLFPYNYVKISEAPKSAPPAAAPAPKATAAKKGGPRARPPPPPAPTVVVQPNKAAAAAAPPVKTELPQNPSWIVTTEAYAKYVGFYETLPKDATGRVTGRDCANFVLQSGLAHTVVERILKLSDLDGDHLFDRDEFAVAMHLALCISKRSMPVPDQLPSYLVPKSKKAIVAARTGAVA